VCSKRVIGLCADRRDYPEIKAELERLGQQKMLSFRHKGTFAFAEFETAAEAEFAKESFEDNAVAGFDFKVKFARSDPLVCCVFDPQQLFEKVCRP